MRQARFTFVSVMAALIVAPDLLALVGCVPRVCAERLSIRQYDDADGLTTSNVKAIYQDGKGYLWFGTSRGLSRFDGYRFKSYQEEDGLSHPFVNAITEDRQGRLWVATNGAGVARLIDSADEITSSKHSSPAGVRNRFTGYRVGSSAESNQVNALVFDLDNNIWCGTDDGLYRAAAGQSQDLRFELVAAGTYSKAFADASGSLWFYGNQTGLGRIVGGRLL